MKKVTEKRRRQILAKASRDLGEPVVPVAVVCASLTAWGSASGANRWPGQLEAMKSNLLHRLIYLREPVRTDKCPKHDGHWSGCAFGNDCDCQKIIDPDDGLVYYDSNVTGWLLDGNPPASGQCGSVSLVGPDGKRLKEPMGCEQVSGHKGACDHGYDWHRGSGR